MTHESPSSEETNTEIEESQEVEKELSKVSRLQEEIRACNDKYIRLLAESENSRKRMQKERSQQIQYALESVLVSMLQPLDQFSAALGYTENMSDEVKNWAKGFEMILQQFKDVLSQNAVTSYESIGCAFDPHLHDAVEMVETDEIPDGFITEELLKGYKMGDRTIRVAKVKVAKKIQNEKKTKGE